MRTTFPGNPLPCAFFSRPSKMPGLAWSIPAGLACPASKLLLRQHGKEAVCAWCYAQQGRYVQDNVQRAQHARWAWLLDSLRTDDGRTFVETMIAGLTFVYDGVAPKDRVFRIHDSGDFFSWRYVECWYDIAAACRDIRFWAPTREHLRPMMLDVLTHLNALPNVSVRPSAGRMGEAPPRIDGLAAGTMVVDPDVALPDGVRLCPTAGKAEASCNSTGCRRCWTGKEAVAYQYHGSAVAKLVRNKYVRESRQLPLLNA